MPQRVALGWRWPAVVWPSWVDALRAIERLVVPQIPLTLTNAVIITAVLARELYPDVARRANERNLAVSTGLANLVLAPFGAMPMCHGAGGLQAHYRFGARSGLATVLLGSVLLGLAIGLPDGAAALFSMIPPAAVGSLLLVAGADLALSRRMFDARPDCWPAIGLTAALTLFVNPAVALAGGWALETSRGPIVREIRRLWRRVRPS